jgi:sulfate adenylyltransferase
MSTITINNENLQDALYLFLGLYKPLSGFMNRDDYNCVLENMTIQNGSTWTLPITLDITKEEYKNAIKSSKVKLVFDKQHVGFIEISDCFNIEQKNDVKKIYGTDDIDHPGVKKELGRSPYRIGGNVIIENENFLRNSITPQKTKKIFSDKKWKKICGFQTRNPIHNAHEYLQRLGLEICDGLFINPSIGWKKKGDFSVEAINIAYTKMIKNYYPSSRVYYEGYKAYFRYAGPREAIFHSLIRKNLGCTHFIIGRDHAGVGGYYAPYAAHQLASHLIQKNDIGIDLLLIKEPYYCKKCGQIVTEAHCNHDYNNIIKISGTKIRQMLKNGKIPNKNYMRPEISKELIKLKNNLFIS